MHIIVSRYIIAFLSFGICFPLGSWFIEIFVFHDLPFSFPAIAQIHREVPIHWVVDLAPFILGFLGFIVGKKNAEAIDQGKMLKTQLKTARKYAQLQKVNVLRITQLSSGISSGEIQLDIDMIDDDDEIGKRILDIKKHLEASLEREKIDRWKSQGLSKFIELIQSKPKDILDKFIWELTKYIDAHAAILYLLDQEDETVMRLSSSYGAKQAPEEIKEGEGEMGQAWIDGKEIILKNIPEEYLRIESGLGDSAPNYVAVTPLKFDEKVVALIEVASFKEIDEERIAFISRVGESLVNSIISEMTNEKTRITLEEINQINEELTSQEEELLQNSEELMATQEELDRQNFLLQNKVDALEYHFDKVEYDIEGNLIKYQLKKE